MGEQTQCKHAGCRCAVPRDRAARGDEYCSDHCAQLGDRADVAAAPCGCGHPACEE